ncbi:GTPase Era [Terriglobus sp.]|uniref:GTPase Era n=1 Tax=Terriglobus sp. TaxID=1889013 RepID=UPI003B004C02
MASLPFRSGFVSIIGRPNAGKSTLLNALVGEKVAIVTHKAQTTRNRILGVLEVPARPKLRSRPAQPAAQVVLVDTPGVHKPSTQLDKRMMQEVHDALESRDAVLFLVDATHRVHDASRTVDREDRKALSAEEDAFALSLLRNVDAPVILVLNKIDLLERDKLLPLIQHWSSKHNFAQVMLISAKKRDGLEELLSAMIALLPEGDRYFPADQLTDQPERFLAAELIREKILLYTGEEVPYASAVIIERWEEPGPVPKPRKGELPKLPLTKIAAAIFVERSGQKAILIGKGGAMLKQIGTAARKELESLLGTRVFLELFVKVREDWRSSRGFVEELDWRRQLEALGEQQSAAKIEE